jgi:arginase
MEAAVQVCLIQVPYMIGDERHPAGAGAQRLAQEASALLAAAGVAAAVARVERGTPFRDSASASRAVNEQLAATVRRAVAAGQLPVVLAGSCDASMGVLGGFDHARCGVVWIDAHADFNTPESTASGFFAGMSLAVITGHCYGSLWAEVGDSTAVPESATVLLGVRDLSPAAERDRLDRSAIHVVSWLDGAPQGDVSAALDALAHRVEDVYLHVDLDAFDPDVAPGIVDDPVPGGVSIGDMEDVVRAVGARFRVAAAAVTTYDPGRDRDDRTLRAALRIVELVATRGKRAGASPVL